MAEKKTVKKTAKAGSKRAKEAAVVAAASVPPRPMPARPAGPTARSCPLVLDGEVDASSFSPNDCLSCGEFDCRFCQSAEGSGTLRSRLFAGGEDEDADGDGFGGDFDFETEEGGGGGEEEDEDLF